MKIENLNRLKRKLILEKDFSKIWTYYMDEFGDHPEFVGLGEPRSSLLLESIILKICQQLFDNQVIIANFLLIYIPEYKFFHAPLLVNGSIGGVIYFEEGTIGLLAIAEAPPSDEVKYSRFSGAYRPPSLQPYDLN